MLATRNQAEQAAGRLLLHKPDRLWLHYCAALIIVFCLIIATYMLNRAMVERGLVAANGIMKSNELVLIADEIVDLSDDLARAEFPDFTKFNKAVIRFETIYGDILTTQVRSDVLLEHFFEKMPPLHRRVIDFLETAKRFSNAPPELRENLNERLNLVYRPGGLRIDLLKATRLTTRQIETEATYYKNLQRGMLAASGLVILAEALFIFRPAQRSVQSSLRAMRDTTNELQASQTELQKVNSQLEYTVKHDQLTDLPNRRSLTEYLMNAITKQGTDGWNLILLGLDDFKSVNDTIGHDYGDALLIAVSETLQSCVDHEDLVAHVGGDEFALISAEAVEHVLERIGAAFEEPFAIKGRRIPINASIGYLEVENKVRKPLDILADAEIALQYSKNTGGNRSQAFTQHLRDDLSMMQQLQLELQDAIRNGEIEPWFQPQVRLSDGRLHGAEVLARWRHPSRGLLTPDVFLPAAERAGLMVDLDHTIWRTALNQARSWEMTNIWRPVISLNAAPDTISDPHMIERFLLTMQRTGLEVDQVIVEVLETTLINGKDDIAAINIDSLAECGIALELDDFGTGYASLSRLTQLPLAGIKLDRSLVAPLPDQAADSVVRAILALASELGLHVIAEGIEETEQAAHLNERGCRIGQGYGFGKPMPPDEFTDWLEINAKAELRANADRARFA